MISVITVIKILTIVVYRTDVNGCFAINVNIIILYISEFGIDRPAVPTGIEHVLSGRIRRGGTRAVHAVNGILHARRLRSRTTG